jgi:hypothetical protein
MHLDAEVAPPSSGAPTHSASLLRITRDEDSKISQTLKEVPVLFDSLRLNLRRTGTLSYLVILPSLWTIRNLGLFTLAWRKREIYSLTALPAHSPITIFLTNLIALGALSEKLVLIPLLASIPLSLVTNIKSSQINQP